MKPERLIVITSAISMALGAIAWAVGRATGTPWIGSVAPWLFGLGVVVAFLPLTGLVVYLVVSFFGNGRRRRR